MGLDRCTDSFKIGRDKSVKYSQLLDEVEPENDTTISFQDWKGQKYQQESKNIKNVKRYRDGMPKSMQIR